MFRDRYGEGGPGSAAWLTGATAAVAQLDTPEIDALLDLLAPIAHGTAAAKGLPTSIASKELELKGRRKARQGSIGREQR